MIERSYNSRSACIVATYSLQSSQCVIKAGWDPGGWIFLNWNQLPRELKLDLVLNYLTVEEAKEERLKAEQNNRRDYSMSEGEAVQQ